LKSLYSAVFVNKRENDQWNFDKLLYVDSHTIAWFLNKQSYAAHLQL